jgi:cysteinyl-tRNA synthetase
VCLDVLRRTLKYLCGHAVQQVVNYTDVDDKTIAGAQRPACRCANTPTSGFARFREDAAQLGHRDAGEYARDRSGQHDGDVRHDPALERNGHTYVATARLLQDRVTAVVRPAARLDHDGLNAGARVDVDEYSKDDARDFVLWKAAKPASRRGSGNGAAWTSRLAHRVLGDGAAVTR